MKIFIFVFLFGGAMCYLPPGKDNILSSIFLRELVNRIHGKGISEGDGVSYLDFTDGMPLDGRSLTNGLEEEQLFPGDYDSMGEFNIHPSIRDQEYMRHSTLWGKQYLNSEGRENHPLRPEGVKSRPQPESTLPAYCSPPNPCPIGYTAEHGCIEDFENTATYSRRYQASQDCMCDTEHMFECPGSNDIDDDEESMDIFDNFRYNRMLEPSNKLNEIFPHAYMVSKKIHQTKESNNPFLAGEKLPVAAKKGNNVIF